MDANGAANDDNACLNTCSNTCCSNTVTLVDFDSKTSCQHSTLPKRMKEAFVFDYKQTILVCSAQTEDEDDKLKCYEWNNEINIMM